MNCTYDRFLRPCVILLLAVIVAPWCLKAQAPLRPKDPPASEVVVNFPPPPSLTDSRLPPAQSVPLFIDWASGSGIEQREIGRKTISAAQGNPAVAQELCREITADQRTDFSRTIIELSVLGELKNPAGEKCLTAFLHQPFPTTGTVTDGEIVEQTTLGSLQGKAVDGLAYAGTPTGDREVLWAVHSHPSRIVRAEAIDAYLWNHQDSSAARAALMKVVLPDEVSFLDRPRYEPGTNADDFNKKLAAYAAKHPAPAPEKVTTPPPPKKYVARKPSTPPQVLQDRKEPK